MNIHCISEDVWVKGDLRPYASFNLEIEYFERVLKKKAIKYIEDGLGPAKAFMCLCGENQFYIRWLEYADFKYKSTIDFMFPFSKPEELLQEIMVNLEVNNENLTWKYNET